MTVTETRNNNLVAESDFQAAINAIKDRPANDDLMKQCHQSLCLSIERIVQPQIDEAYLTYLYQTTKRDTESKQVNDRDFDESELIDQSALNRVKELRENVRKEAQKIKDKRQQLLQRAIQLADRQIKLLNQVKEPKIDDSKLNQVSQESKKSMQQLQAVLQNVHNSLNKVNANMPESIENIDGTIKSIQNTLGKGLSQTEKAIIQSQQQENLPIDVHMDPEQRLAQLLG